MHLHFSVPGDVSAHLNGKVSPTVLAAARYSYPLFFECNGAVQHSACRKKRKQFRYSLLECDQNGRDDDPFSGADQLEMRCAGKRLYVVYMPFFRYIYSRALSHRGGVSVEAVVVLTFHCGSRYHFLLL